jgi:hypothetical protein
MAPKQKQQKDTLSFTTVRNFPRYKTFEILKQPETSFFKTFMGTFSQLVKGD